MENITDNILFEDLLKGLNIKYRLACSDVDNLSEENRKLKRVIQIFVDYNDPYETYWCGDEFERLLFDEYVEWR